MGHEDVHFVRKNYDDKKKEKQKSEKKDRNLIKRNTSFVLIAWEGMCLGKKVVQRMVINAGSATDLITMKKRARLRNGKSVCMREI